MAWATKTQARDFWPDATAMPDTTLDSLLTIATEQCTEFAPALAQGDPLPERYMLATIYQAREVWAAMLRGEQDVIGIGDYAIRARPLTAAVKQLLRPQHGRPVVG